MFGTLKKMDAPKELYDATALLLQSSLLDEDTAMLLTKDIMELSANDEPSTTIDQADESSPDDTLCASVIHSSSNDSRKEDESNQGTDLSETSVNIHQEEISNETSALLATSTENEEMLKPSIFTMHSVTPNEEEKED